MSNFALLALLALTIDGRLSDPFWASIAPQSFADSGGGQIRAVVAGRYLYVAAEFPERSGRLTARSIGRNPAWEDEDMIRITCGADIGYTDRVLQVSPLGAYSLEKAGHVVWSSLDVFPYSDEREAQVVAQNIDRFLVATHVGGDRWSAEVAFPLSELSAPGPDRIYATIERVRAQRPGSPRQVWRWPVRGPAARIPVVASVPWDSPPAEYRSAPLGNQDSPIEVGRVAKLPALDSDWNEKSWRDAPARKLLRDEWPRTLPRMPTEVKLLHDGKTLAVLARCVETDSVSAQVKENDGAVTNDDSLQVYLSTSGSTYVQVAVNALGYLRDATGFSGGSRISRPREWDSGALAHVSVQPGAWIARLDIPLQPAAEVLGEGAIPSDWRILLLRFRRGRPGDAREVSVLPVIQSETALCPARYRRLHLAAVPPSALVRNQETYAAPETPAIALVLSAEQRRERRLAEMVALHLRQRAMRMLESDQEEWAKVNTRSDWERYRAGPLKALREWLGPFPQRTSLAVEVTKEYSGNGYRRQDLLYQSRPGLWVTANLYLPPRPAREMPGIVIIPSHHRPRTQAELQDMGILWARVGCAVLIPELIGHGERIQTYPWNREGYRSRYTMGMQLYVAGESLIKWMVWDTMRGIDLLAERGDVDMDKIVLLGAVAGGGDPAAVTAAIDPRVAAVAPFSFGESVPELGPGGSRFPRGLAQPGWGSWETTRNLPRSIVDRYFQWMICASVAPRRFVYSYEMGWDVERVPTWPKYRKVFGFYNAVDNLDEAHGFGTFPGPGECANIGPAQRKTLYPELERWFGIPPPKQEPDDRRPEAELAALSSEAAGRLKMRMLHEMAYETAATKLNQSRREIAKLDTAHRRDWLRKKWAAILGDVAPNRSAKFISHWKETWGKAEAEGLTLEVEPGIVVPVLLLKPVASRVATPIVTVVSQGGKERLLVHRRQELDRILSAGIAVCLPDVRGVGETSPDCRRTPQSEEISLAATELMLGNTLLGARLKDLRTVLAFLTARSDVSPEHLAVWGDSDAAVNPRRLLLDETPGWLVGPDIQQQAEPLGGLLALFAGLYEDSVKAVAVRGSLVSYLSILEDPFAYVPSDVVIPGAAETGDLPEVTAAFAPRPLFLDCLVDGRNRKVPEPELKERLAPIYTSYGGNLKNLQLAGGPGGSALPDWIIAQLQPLSRGVGKGATAGAGSGASIK
jgi:dienelactone hydrolase